MVIVLLIAGIGFVLAGLLAIIFGMPVKEFSFGNTLILAGAIMACTGMVMVGLWTAVRELRNIAQRLDPGAARNLSAPGNQAEADGGFLLIRDQAALEGAGNAEPAAQPESVEAAPASKPRRNLLFSSSSRKERERAQARTADPSAADLRPQPAAPAAEPSVAPPATFDDAWPKSERARAADVPPPRRPARAPSTFTDAASGAAGADRYPPAARSEDQPPVTVLKSGVVDGMAYSLYSDGSIEAQMPEGMMRFASIDELRAHLEQRS
jgi:hypothetical protein